MKKYLNQNYIITSMNFMYKQNFCESVFIDKRNILSNHGTQKSLAQKILLEIKKIEGFEPKPIDIKNYSQLRVVEKIVKEFSLLNLDQKLKDLVIISEGISWFEANELFGEVIITNYQQKKIPIKITNSNINDFENFELPLIYF